MTVAAGAASDVKMEIEAHSRIDGGVSDTNHPWEDQGHAMVKRYSSRMQLKMKR
jgi:hypothetical protein